MHGVTLHTGTVLTAGSTVIRDTLENTIAGGNPAKFIQHERFNQGVAT